MKKGLLSIVALFAVMHSANAQAEKEPKGGFGIKAGANMSNVHHQKDTPVPFEKESDYRFGYHVGVFAEAFVDREKKISIQPEMFYSQEGYLIKDFDYKGQKGELDYSLNTYNLPILFKYYFTKNFNVFVGPQVVYQESSKYKFEGNEINISEAGHQRRITSTNLNVVSGIEFATVGGFSINARYLHGAHTIYKTRDNVQLTHRGFHMGMGYKF